MNNDNTVSKNTHGIICVYSPNNTHNLAVILSTTTVPTKKLLESELKLPNSIVNIVQCCTNTDSSTECYRNADSITESAAETQTEAEM